MRNSRKLGASGAFIVSVAIAFYSLANTATLAADGVAHAVMNKHADISPMCGTKPVIVAHVDGFGGATWFKTAAAEFKDELSKCPNVKKVTYLDANNDAQKYNSDINSLVSQGANVIVAFTNFGAKRPFPRLKRRPKPA